MYVPMVALNSSTRRHQLLISVHTYASLFIAYSKFNNIEMYSREKEINKKIKNDDKRRGKERPSEIKKERRKDDP